MSQVNLNGALFFDTTNGAYTPQAFPLPTYSIIAPYWADVDVRRNNGRLYYRATAGTLESVMSHGTLVMVMWRTLLNIIDNGAYF